jgi:hypothetical protein
MKSTELKNMIKEAVREAIQEELKDILLEAVKAPKASTVAVVQESVAPLPIQPQQPQMNAEQKREAYQNILGEMGNTMTTNNVPQRFNPAGGDSINGSLPAGEVDMSQIANLMGKR